MQIEKTYKQFFIDPKKPIIIEVGAGAGTMLDGYIREYPNPTIYAFEPMKVSFLFLENRYKNKNNVNVYPYALGNRNGKVKFNLNSRDIASSTQERTPAMAETFKTEQVTTIDCARLDDLNFVDALDRIDLLNIITEGSELDVLEGSVDVLKRVRVVTVQVFMTEIYTDQVYYYDVDKFLREKGFSIFKFYDAAMVQTGQLARCIWCYINTNLGHTKEMQ